MRKYLVFFIILFAPIFATSAYAAVCSYPTYDCNSSSQEVHGEFNCAATSYICFKGIKYATCSSCQTGFSMYQGSYTVSSSNCTIPYNSCTATRCNGCTEGISYTNWTNAPSKLVVGNRPSATVPGYQVRTKTTCNTTTNYICQNTTEFRCSASWYGTNPTRTLTGAIYTYSGCNECPDVSDMDPNYIDASYKITSDPGNNATIEKCYIDGVTTDNLLADLTGKYTIYGGKCYYKQ